MKKIRVLLAGLGVLVLAACTPTFPEGAELIAEDQAPYVSLTWPTASGANEDWPVTGYAVSVDGVEVEITEDWVEGCLLQGLADNSTYVIEVRAVDGQNSRSNPLTATHSTGTIGNVETDISCSTAPPTFPGS